MPWAYGKLKLFCCASETNLTTLSRFCRGSVVFAGAVPDMSGWHQDHPWPSHEWYNKCLGVRGRPRGLRSKRFRPRTKWRSTPTQLSTRICSKITRFYDKTNPYTKIHRRKIFPSHDFSRFSKIVPNPTKSDTKSYQIVPNLRGFGRISGGF